jgi:hypothetical protein
MDFVALGIIVENRQPEEQVLGDVGLDQGEVVWAGY